MKMQVPSRRHRGLARLERKPLAAADRDFRIVDRAAENAAGEGEFALGEPALAADRTGERGFYLSIPCGVDVSLGLDFVTADESHRHFSLAAGLDGIG